MPLFKKRHTGHENHLCRKVEGGTTLSAFLVLIRNPKYVCMQCGRAAAKAENLCDPTPI